MAHVSFRDEVGRGLKLGRWGVALFPKLAGWRGDVVFLEFAQQVVEKSLLRSYGEMVHGGRLEGRDLLVRGCAGKINRNRCFAAGRKSS